MRQNLGTATSRARDYSDKTYSDSLGSGTGNVVGQASSVDSEVALFSGTGGKTIKRATGTGLMRLISGVYSAVSRTIDGQTFDGSANITVIAPGIHAATGKSTPVDADELALVDSAASNVLKKLTWADLKATAALATVNLQTGTTYTLVLADSTKLVELSNASPVTLTVPPNSAVAIPVGAVIPVDAIGAGQVTIAAGAGVTVNSRSGNLKLTGQYSSACLRKRATDSWILTGDLTA